MKESSGGFKLYNVIFPVWMLLLFPAVWLVVFPGNFIIDSLVLIAAMFYLKIEDKKAWYKKHILKIFAFGMISDMIGSLFLLLVLYITGWLGIDVISADGVMYTVPALLLAALLIYVFNYYVTFKKAENPVRRQTSLIFAIVTAPYTFLIPISWMY